MKLGILADIHEDLEHLRGALDALRDRGADRLILLGDLFELGHRLDATVELLDEAGAVGVWGNHDFGLCRDPHEDVRRRFSEETMAFMGRLRPRHRWLLATPEAVLPWDGGGPVVLEPDRRSFVIVNAVVEGWCALFDTAAGRLVPIDLGREDNP